jgi:hypothetical protein
LSELPLGLIKSSGFGRSLQEEEKFDEGFGIVSEGGMLNPSLEVEEDEFCLEMVIGLLEYRGAGGEGLLEGFVGEQSPSSFLALRITE